jgi:lysozyme
MSVLGIDVSHHNGEINWSAVARSDVRFAFTKATDGSSFVDPMFRDNWPGIRDAGLLRSAFHFARPGSDPIVQATQFASVVGPLSWGELPPVLDLEVMDGQPKQAVLEWTLAFVREAELLFGCQLIIYTGGLWRIQLGNPSVPELSTRLLWTARYGEHPPITPASWQTWSFWQFTDGKSGSVQDIAGVSGPCDCDWYQGDLASLQAMSNRLALAPGPVPAPTPPLQGHAWPGRWFVWPAHPTVRGPDVSTWQTRVGRRGFAVTADGLAEARIQVLDSQQKIIFDKTADEDGLFGFPLEVRTQGEQLTIKTFKDSYFQQQFVIGPAASVKLHSVLMPRPKLARVP